MAFQITTKDPLLKEIFELVHHLGLKQTDFVKRSGFDASSLYQWASDIRSPSLRQVREMAQALNMNIDHKLTLRPLK